MKDKTIEIPKNIAKPPYERIFCVDFIPPEQTIQEAGKPKIIKPDYLEREVDGRTERIQLKRYFVVDIHPECQLYKKDGVRRGDEICPFIPDSALGYDPVKIRDFINGEDYIVMHESEIGGFIRQADMPKQEE